MKDSNRHYGEPKGRIFDQAQNLRDVTIVGTNERGERVVWSSLDEPKTSALFEQIASEPAQG